MAVKSRRRIHAHADRRQHLEPFESLSRTGSGGELHAVARGEIAQIHLDRDDPAAALEYANAMSDAWSGAGASAKLLLRIHERLGNVEQATEIAWAAFRERRSTESLDDLLAVIGEDKRAHAIDQSVEIINSQEAWSPSDACFLVEVGRLDQAEACVLRSAKQLDGDRYTQLLHLAETLEDDQRFRCASVLYRALLDSILRRAKSKIYHHAARYLGKLATLEKRVSDWGDVEDHRSYRQRLKEQHRRKHAFWGLVEG